MYRTMCKSKIHRATVTEANLNYIGSITIDDDLLRAADILPFERVQVVNVTNGERLETYALAGDAGTGVVCLNGAAARRAAPGDIVIVMSYGMFAPDELESFALRLVLVDSENHITATRSHALGTAEALAAASQV